MAQSDQSPAGVAPYFEVIFGLLKQQDPETVAAFGRHVHWGYWDDPATFDGTAANYGAAAERLCRRVCDAAQIRDGQDVLDVGCGFGGTIASLNERFDRLNLTGLNIDDRQLDRARAEVQPRGQNRVQFVCGDACAMPLEDAQYDVVLAVECVFHFPDRGRFLQEAARVLRKGGVLSLCDFLPEEHVVPYLEAAEFSPLGNQSTIKSYGRIDVQCSEAVYRRLAEAAGLTLSRDEDMTPHTLPTYRFLRSRMGGWDDPQLAADYDRTTAQLEAMSKKGFLRYRILTFRKE